MIDLLIVSTNLTRAIEVLDLHGHVEPASVLRRDTPELLRLARLGQKVHDRRGADDPSRVETQPLTRKNRDHA